MGSHAIAADAPDVRSVLDALRRLVRVLRVSSTDAERRAGLTGAQLFVLQAIAATPGISLRELASRTHTDPSSVSIVAARLVVRELVSRKTSKQDARRAELWPTAAGRAVLRKAPITAQSRLVAVLAALPAARRRQLAASLETLLTAMGADDELPGMFFEDELMTPKTRSKR